MQIKSIVLYKKNKKERILNFKLGKLNIITGESKSGKTAIIDIINYCLGSNSCEIKGDKIIHVVEYFGILLQLKDMQVFIARQNPFMISQASTSEIFFKYEKKISIPVYSELESNSNTTALINFFSEKLRIGDNIHVPPDMTREPLSANFKHSRIFCYQPQNVVAEFKYLFFNQDESWVEQAIKDTFPFFLGAIREDEFLIHNEIREITRQLNKLYRKKKEYESLIDEGFEQLDNVIEEAIELDLINHSILSKTKEEKISYLQDINYEDKDEFKKLGENERLNDLISQKNELKHELDNKACEISATEQFISSSVNYKDEVMHQEARLMSIGLYKEPAERKEWNSLLGEYSDTIPPRIEQLNQSLISLKENLEISNKGVPKFASYLNDLKEKYVNLQDQIKKIDEKISAIYKEKEEVNIIRNENIRRGKIIGKIELLLESIKNVHSDSSLLDTITALEEKKILLQAKVSNEQQEEILDSALTRINELMTSWSEKINFEYPGVPLRLSIRKLTLIAETTTGPLPLNRIGGAENWLACHLFVHLALHQYFVEKNRPIPRFLIIDQPTQVHYPENYIETPGHYKPSQDEAADIKMFNFLMEYVHNLSPNFQIIVTDHANFHYKEYEDCIREIWRDGKKLVPEEWYE